MVKAQKGVGLIEVLVSLLLLAVAILGFTAMQMSAIKATDESLMRTRAMAILKNAAETMRANASGIDAFKTAINGSSTSISNNETSNVAITKDSCVVGGTPEKCTIKQLAVKDALTVKQFATANKIKVGMATCPVVSVNNGSERQCLLASWDETDPIFLDTPVASDTTKDQPCANESGNYYAGVSCFIMEAY